MEGPDIIIMIAFLGMAVIIGGLTWQVKKMADRFGSDVFIESRPIDFDKIVEAREDKLNRINSGATALSNGQSVQLIDQGDGYEVALEIKRRFVQYHAAKAADRIEIIEGQYRYDPKINVIRIEFKAEQK